MNINIAKNNNNMKFGDIKKKWPFFILYKSIKAIFIIKILMYIQIHLMTSKLKNTCTKFLVDRFINFRATFPGAEKLTFWETRLSFRSWKVPSKRIILVTS